MFNNKIDLDNLSSCAKESFRDRLTLDNTRIDNMISSVQDIIKLPDPIGKMLDIGVRPNGLKIKKVRSPIGVVGIIYESRPNVTTDASALCIKSGNS